jgi:hypothetical protein
MEIRYEQLIVAPQPQLERLARFLRIEFDAAMLEYGRASDVLPRHGQDVRAREPLQPEVRRWRTELSRDDISVIESIAGELMDEVGYPRELGMLTPRAAITIAAERHDRRRERWLRDGAPALGALLRKRIPGL